MSGLDTQEVQLAAVLIKYRYLSETAFLNMLLSTIANNSALGTSAL